MTVLENKGLNKFGTAIILAGGKSSRMGFDKQFLEIGERRIMYDLVHKLEEEFDEIIIVTNKPEEYGKVRHKITSDIIVGKGPLSGIHVGLKESSSNYAFIIGCDMPNINIPYIRHMKEIIGEQDIDGCIARIGNLIEPFHGFYSKNIIKNIERYLNENKRSVNNLAEKLNFIYIEENQVRKFNPNFDMFLNLNTQEDINRYMDK